MSAKKKDQPSGFGKIPSGFQQQPKEALVEEPKAELEVEESFIDYNKVPGKQRKHI